MATLSTYALTSLADLQEWLGVTDAARDDELIRAINFQSRAIERYCNRRFASRSYVQFFEVNGDTLLLPNYPVTTLTKIAAGRQRAISVTYSGSTSNPRLSTTDTAGVASDAPNAKTATVVCQTESGSTSISTAAPGQTTLAGIVTAISAVSGFSATLQYTTGAAGAHIATDIMRLPSESVQSRTVYLDIPSQAWTDYSLDPESGVIKFNADLASNNKQNVRVEFTAGYSSVQTADETADLAQACRVLCQMALDEQGEGVNVQSESLGDFSQTFANIERSEVLKDLLSGFVDYSRMVA